MANTQSLLLLVVAIALCSAPLASGGTFGAFNAAAATTATSSSPITAQNPLFQPRPQAPLSPVKTSLTNVGSSVVSIAHYIESRTQRNTPMQISCLFAYTSLIIRGELCRWDSPMDSTASCVVLSALSAQEIGQGKHRTVPYTLPAADRHSTYCCKDFSFSSEGNKATLIGCGTVDGHVQSPSTPPNTPDTSVPTVMTTGGLADPSQQTLKTAPVDVTSSAPPSTVHQNALTIIVALICVILVVAGTGITFSILCQCKKNGTPKLIAVRTTNELHNEVKSAQRVADLSPLHDPIVGKKQYCSWPKLDAASSCVEDQLPVESGHSVRAAFSILCPCKKNGTPKLIAVRTTNELHNEVKSAQRVADFSPLHDPIVGKKQYCSWPKLDAASSCVEDQLPVESGHSVRAAFSVNDVGAARPAHLPIGNSGGFVLTKMDHSATVGVNISVHVTHTSSVPKNLDLQGLMLTCANMLPQTEKNGVGSKDRLRCSSLSALPGAKYGSSLDVSRRSPAGKTPLGYRSASHGGLAISPLAAQPTTVNAAAAALTTSGSKSADSAIDLHLSADRSLMTDTEQSGLSQRSRQIDDSTSYDAVSEGAGFGNDRGYQPSSPGSPTPNPTSPTSVCSSPSSEFTTDDYTGDAFVVVGRPRTQTRTVDGWEVVPDAEEGRRDLYAHSGVF